MQKYLYLGVGGLAGTFARYFLSMIVQRASGMDFPVGTLAVNILGCVIIGIFTAFGEERGLSPEAGLLLITGFCGAFTTFSAYIFETHRLFGIGQIAKAACYIAASTALGLAAFRGGFLIFSR